MQMRRKCAENGEITYAQKEAARKASILCDIYGLHEEHRVL